MDHFLGLDLLVGQLLKRCKPLRGKPELLLALVKRIRRILQFLEQEPDRRRVAALHDLLPAEKHLADGIGVILHRQLLVERANGGSEGVVNADDFLAFDHGKAQRKGVFAKLQK